MSALLSRLLWSRTGAVWSALIVVTVISVGIGLGSRGSTLYVDTFATELVLAIAFIKVRFIGTDFMEVHEAPVALRRVLDVWTVAAFIVLSAFHLAQL